MCHNSDATKLPSEVGKISWYNFNRDQDHMKANSLHILMRLLSELRCIEGSRNPERKRKSGGVARCLLICSYSEHVTHVL